MSLCTFKMSSPSIAESFWFCNTTLFGIDKATHSYGYYNSVLTMRCVNGKFKVFLFYPGCMFKGYESCSTHFKRGSQINFHSTVSKIS